MIRLGGRPRIVLAAAFGLLGCVAVTGTAAAAASPVPYTDPDAVGSIGLCNQAGQQITTGSVTARPFAWRAVSTQPAQAPYDGAGRTAVLVAYQPQQGLPPGDWNGVELTASSRYTNPANPMVAATDGDLSLDDFLEQYAPKWDGFVQLRMFLGAPQQTTQTVQYPALNIQVTGNTWKAIGGSPVNCSSGTSESIESILLPPSTTSTTSVSSTTSTTTGVASNAGKGTSSDGSGSSDSHSSGSKAASAGKALVSGTPTASAAAGTSVAPLLLGVGLAVLVALSVLAYVLRRRRQLSSAHPGGDSDLNALSSTSTKGDSQ